MKKIKFSEDFFASGNTMIGQNQRGLVFLSTTTIVKSRAARCGAVCGGEITMMEQFLWISSR